MAAKMKIETTDAEISIKFVGLELHINYKPVANFNSYALRERDQFIDAIEAMTRGRSVVAMTQVSEKLPTPNCRVLVCERRKPGRWHEARYIDDIFETTLETGEVVECFPTHWMLLPEAK